jgi:hypothetical protein
MVRVEVAAEVAWSDLTRRNGGEVKEPHGNPTQQAGIGALEAGSLTTGASAAGPQASARTNLRP